MNKIIRIGMDTSKSFFQLHGVDAEEKVVLRRTLRRREMLAFFEKLAATEIGMIAAAPRFPSSMAGRRPRIESGVRRAKEAGRLDGRRTCVILVDLADRKTDLRESGRRGASDALG